MWPLDVGQTRGRKTPPLARVSISLYSAAIAAEEHEHEADELLLRDLPGKLAILVFAAATLALGWELFGILFQFGWPFIRALDASDIIGVALFTTGWIGLLIGLLVLRHRRQLSAD